jgi:hypothetical protein
MLVLLLLVLVGALCFIRASRKARERSLRIRAYRPYVPRCERDCWFV